MEKYKRGAETRKCSLELIREAQAKIEMEGVKLLPVHIKRKSEL